MTVGSIVIQEEDLIKRLLAQQPSAEATVKRLRLRFEGRSAYGAFAPIRKRSCGACKMTVAWERLQRAQTGAFITCAHCARFLYVTIAE